MLSKERCTQAISSWKKTRTDFSKIKKIIDPTAGFNFTQEDCGWVTKNNKFHAHAGVNNDELLLIIVPLDKNGKFTLLAINE
jgi:hypothetical protein